MPPPFSSRRIGIPQDWQFVYPEAFFMIAIVCNMDYLCNHKMKQQSRSIITGILVVAGRELTATQLIRLAEPIGLSASNVKSHLTRMVKEGALERKGPARLATYKPSVAQMVVISGIQARLTERADKMWDGTWLMLALRLPPIRRQRERVRASLWFDGFRAVGPELFVRPAWPLPWGVNRALQYLAEVPGVCMQGCFLHPHNEFETLYDLDGINSEASELATWIRRRTDLALSPRAAFIERINVGGRVARLLGHDPRLPPALWHKRRGLVDTVDAFRRFEKDLAPRANLFVQQATTTN